MVLLSGDLANIPMEFQETSSKEELAKHHQDLVRVVDEFVPIAQQVFYLPGNVSCGIFVKSCSKSSVLHEIVL